MPGRTSIRSCKLRRYHDHKFIRIPRSFPVVNKVTHSLDDSDDLAVYRDQCIGAGALQEPRRRGCRTRQCCKSHRSGSGDAPARPGSGEIVSSGDAVADATARKRVLEAYDSKHQVVTEGGDKAVLVIGNEEWPFPIPLVRKDGSWQFDTAAGREEILARRIGRNELNTIEACLAFVDAQQEYAEKGVAGNGVYAQRIVSHPG